jgi:hypothetical protein
MKINIVGYFEAAPRGRRRHLHGAQEKRYQVQGAEQAEAKAVRRLKAKTNPERKSPRKYTMVYNI